MEYCRFERADNLVPGEGYTINMNVNTLDPFLIPVLY